MQEGDIKLILKNIDRQCKGFTSNNEELHIAIVNDILYNKKGQEIAASIEYINLCDLTDAFNINQLKLHTNNYFNKKEISYINIIESSCDYLELRYKVYQDVINNFLQKFLLFKNEYNNRCKNLDNNNDIKKLDELILDLSNKKFSCIEKKLKTVDEINLEINLSISSLISEKNEILNKKSLDEVDCEKIVTINNNIKLKTNEIEQKYDAKILNKDIEVFAAKINYYLTEKQNLIKNKPAEFENLNYIKTSIIEKYQPISDYLENMKILYFC